MSKFTILAGVALFAVSGAAVAQPAPQRGQRAADVTQAQFVARAEQRFARLDVNSDGRVTREEARQAHQQQRAQREQRRAERLARLTPEQRARIEQRRAQRGERAGRRGQGPFGAQGFVTREQFRERALARFARLDLDRNGVVTVAERLQLRQQRMQRRQERATGVN